MKDYDVIIGRLVQGNKTTALVRLDWDNNIGALVVGRPGSGKSHVIASLLTQYVLKGVDVVMGEFNADEDNPQSLIYRIRHIHTLEPIAVSGQEVENLIIWLGKELKQRQDGKKEKTPLVVVIDEFFAFSNIFKPAKQINRQRKGNIDDLDGETLTIRNASTYWEMLMGILSDLRKNNIRVILATQEPAASASTVMMRQARDMFKFKLIMNLGNAGANLLGITDRESQRIIAGLKPGFIFYRGSYRDIIIGVPFPINQEWIDACSNNQRAHTIKAVKQYIWTQEDTDLYLDALFRYWTKFDTISIDGHRTSSALDTKEQLIKLLVLCGKSNRFIRTCIRGTDAEIIKIANSFRTTDAQDEQDAHIPILG